MLFGVLYLKFQMFEVVADSGRCYIIEDAVSYCIILLYWLNQHVMFAVGEQFGCIWQLEYTMRIMIASSPLGLQRVKETNT